MVNIYTLSHPITGEIRYVGKTNRTLEKRLYGHLHRKSSVKSSCWIKSLESKGLTPIIELIDVVSEENWEEEEKFYISYCRFLGFDLTNMDEGGVGMIGYRITDEVKAKMRKSRTGKPCKEETKRKISQSLKGHTLSEERRRKIANTLRGRTPIETPARAESTRKMIALKRSKMKRVGQFDINWDLIKEHTSLSDAAKMFDCSHTTLLKAINGRTKLGLDRTAYGYKWKYL